MVNKKKLLIADTVSINGIGGNCRNQQIFFVGVVVYSQREEIHKLFIKQGKIIPPEKTG